MNIGFDAMPLIHPVGGIARYVQNLLKALLEIQRGEVFFGYIPIGTLSRLPWGGDEYRDHLQWKEVQVFRNRGAKDQLDIFHGTNFKLQTSGRYGTVLTIHDLWLDRHPEYSKKLFGQRLSFYRTKRRAQQATRIIAVSNFTAKEIQELYEVPREKITVVYHGVDEAFFPHPGDDREFKALRGRLGIPDKPFVLFLGGANPRKNHKTLLQAISSRSNLRRDFSLVIIGDSSFKDFTIEKTIFDCHLQGCVICVENVSFEELRVLYSRAALFVFPSRYEGFGFPVLEAMACGVPVITSQYSALPEIAGDAAVLVEPENVEALAQAIEDVLGNADFQKSLREKGLTRARSFKWIQSAEKTLQVYQGIRESN